MAAAEGEETHGWVPKIEFAARIVTSIQTLNSGRSPEISTKAWRIFP